MGYLDGRVALVFGAGSSGEAISNPRAAVIVFGRESARVAAIDRDTGTGPSRSSRDH